MNAERTHIADLECPSPDDLLDYARWDSTRANFLVTHLEHCERCVAALNSALNADEMVEAMRWCNPLQALAGEPEFKALLGKFATSMAPDTDSTVPCAVATTDATECDYSAQIGGYMIVKELARGGMGIVFQAYQAALNRNVALKMLLPDSRQPDLLERFRLESKAIARLQHPQIIQIFEFGEHEGHPYFSMELMEGGDLEQRIDRQGFTPEGAADLTVLLAEAVQYSHDKGILHRDLKPSNVLFTAAGVPKIGDFGLAKYSEEENERGLTQADVVMGTPSYMAPEQARGAVAEIGPATDVYGLGGLLYRMLTGLPPHKGKNKLETLELVRLQSPQAPSRHNPRVCPDLEAICLKCLAKSPQQRYETAAEFAADVRRWQAGEMPNARRERRWRRLATLAVSALLVFMLAVLTYLVGTKGATILAQYDTQARFHWMEKQLRKGRPVTLVGATGLPRWHRITGEPGAADALELGHDGTATARSRGPTFVVLVENPQQDHYRFRAEVRHDLAGRTDCGAGLFVGLREHPLAADPMQAAVLLRFSDLRDSQDSLDIVRQYRPDAQLPRFVGNRLQFMPYLLIARLDLPEPLEAKLAGADLAFEPAIDGRRWRQLEVRVHPDRLLAGWEDGGTPLELPMVDVRDRSATRLEVWYNRFHMPPPQSFATPEVRGSLGIYLRNGSVSIRNATIEPLAENADESH